MLSIAQTDMRWSRMDKQIFVFCDKKTYKIRRILYDIELSVDIICLLKFLLCTR